VGLAGRKCKNIHLGDGAEDISGSSVGEHVGELLYSPISIRAGKGI
jgi:hypothetical protein